MYEREAVRLIHPVHRTLHVHWSLTLLEQMQTRHSNLIAMAHFHKTRAEPALVSDPPASFILNDQH